MMSLCHSSCATEVSACGQHHIPLHLTLRPRGHRWQEQDIHHPSPEVLLLPLGLELSMASDICHLQHIEVIDNMTHVSVSWIFV